MRVYGMIFVLIVVMVACGISFAQQQKMPTTIPGMVKLMEGRGHKVVQAKAKIVEKRFDGTCHLITYDVIGRNVVDGLYLLPSLAFRGAHLVQVEQGQIQGFVVTTSVVINNQGGEEGGLQVFQAQVTYSYPQKAADLFDQGDEVVLLLPEKKK